MRRLFLVGWRNWDLSAPLQRREFLHDLNVEVDEAEFSVSKTAKNELGGAVEVGTKHTRRVACAKSVIYTNISANALLVELILCFLTRPVFVLRNEVLFSRDVEEELEDVVGRRVHAELVHVLEALVRVEPEEEVVDDVEHADQVVAQVRCWQEKMCCCKPVLLKSVKCYSYNTAPASSLH